MEINIRHEDNLIIELNGRLDTSTSTILEQKINSENINEETIILDFKNLDYISSAGLRILLSLKKNLEAQNKKLEIHNINSVVREVFRVTGFINVLTIK